MLAGWGMGDADIELAEPAVVYADISGIDSHGIATLLVYDPLIDDGAIDMTATVSTMRETPAIAVLDGGGGLGHPVGTRAMDLAVDKARALGIGAVAVANSRHFGATGYYVRRAAAAGLIGIATTSTRTPAVTPTGGGRPVLGTNPLAFAAPLPAGEPLVLDMSTSTVAMNKIKAYALRDKPLPPGWVLDGAGASVSDAAMAHRGLVAGALGGLAPLGGSGTLLGGHKGYGLSLMVQILSAALSGAALPTREPGERENVGHFFLAMDPEHFAPGGAAQDYTGELTELMHAVTPTDEGPPVLVPGEPEAATRAERIRDGIPLPDSLLVALRDLCERRGVEFVLATESAAQ